MRKARAKYHYYSKEELEWIRENGPNHTAKELAKAFNERFNLEQSSRQVSQRRQKLGVSSKFTHLMKIDKKGKFRKGGISWNKGKKGFMGPNKTSFKKGDIPANYRPVGSERVNVYGYTEVKVSDSQPWKLKHRIIYEEHKGAIPEGCAIMFGDGDKSNLSIENLVLVTRNQLARFNQKGLLQADADHTRAMLQVVKLNEAVISNEKTQKP